MTPTEITACDLRKAEAAHQAASRRYEQTRQHRNDLVQVALGAGWTQQAIADAVGITKTRVGQIVQSGR
jgi:hypothetical protein